MLSISQGGYCLLPWVTQGSLLLPEAECICPAPPGLLRPAELQPVAAPPSPVSLADRALPPPPPPKRRATDETAEHGDIKRFKDVLSSRSGRATTVTPYDDRETLARKMRREGQEDARLARRRAQHTAATGGPTGIRLTHAGELARIALTKPDRLPPLVLSGPHELALPFHEDWTRVPNSRHDAEAWDMELRLREVRNEMIRDSLLEGRTVWYTSTGNSLWPLVHSGDACTYEPTQVAKRGPFTYLPEIHMNEVVFCQVQPSKQFYAHLVLGRDWDRLNREWRWTIGNIKGHKNGWVLARHVFGILTRVQYWDEDKNDWVDRPHPRTQSRDRQGQIQYQ